MNAMLTCQGCLRVSCQILTEFPKRLWIVGESRHVRILLSCSREQPDNPSESADAVRVACPGLMKFMIETGEVLTTGCRTVLNQPSPNMVASHVEAPRSSTGSSSPTLLSQTIAHEVMGFPLNTNPHMPDYLFTVLPTAHWPLRFGKISCQDPSQDFPPVSPQHSTALGACARGGSGRPLCTFPGWPRPASSSRKRSVRRCSPFLSGAFGVLSHQLGVNNVPERGGRCTQ